MLGRLTVAAGFSLDSGLGGFITLVMGHTMSWKA